MVVERILVIGKTQPDWANREDDLVSCTVGINEQLEWRRMRHATLSSVQPLRTFTWADIDLVEPTGPYRDPRPESRELNPSQDGPIEVIGRVEDKSLRRGYTEACVEPSIAHMRKKRKTLGIIKPIELDFEILEKIPKKEKEVQTSLLDWLSADDPYMRKLAKDRKWKKQYAEKPVEVRFHFYCGDSCQDECNLKSGKHDFKVLDIELFMLFRHCSKKGRTIDEAIELMAQKIESDNSKLDIFLGVGTHRYYPFQSYMVGSSMRFKKDIAPTPIDKKGG